MRYFVDTQLDYGIDYRDFDNSKTEMYSELMHYNLDYYVMDNEIASYMHIIAIL